MLKNFWMDDTGAIVSIEMIIIITVAVLALIVGWSEVAVAVNTELNDISNAVGSLSQSFAFIGFSGAGPGGGGKTKSVFFGSTFQDIVDDCDTNLTCDIVGVLGGGGIVLPVAGG